jgi:hypothetical protein
MPDTPPPPPPPPAFDAQRIATVREIRDSTASLVMSIPNVNAVGVGYKSVGQRRTPDLCVVVSVDRKLPLGQLGAADRVPPAIQGVPTDVVETGPFTALASDARAIPGQRLRPARPGLSIGQAGDPSAGTFGCLVRREERLFILSNNHVLGSSNQATLGSVILQPAVLDGGSAEDRIARLVDFVPLAFDGAPAAVPPSGCAARVARLFGGPLAQVDPVNAAGRNRVDCALAGPDDPALVSPDILNIGVPAGIAPGGLGAAVQKSGRTTGHTTGEILQIDVSVRVGYGGRSATFVDQLMTGPLSQAGDSGSAVLDMERRVVGLLFAGSGSHTLLNPIQAVLEALRAEMVTDGE